jgi:hypothetical protein
MSSWTYIHSETGWTNEDGEYIPGLWTVGHSDAAGSWHPESEHDDPEAAAARVHWLNGGRRCDRRPRRGGAGPGVHRHP